MKIHISSGMLSKHFAFIIKLAHDKIENQSEFKTGSMIVGSGGHGSMRPVVSDFLSSTSLAREDSF